MKNRYQFWWYHAAEFIAIMPIVVAVFPIPLVVPVMVICSMPVYASVFYFCYLLLGAIFIYYMETKYP